MNGTGLFPPFEDVEKVLIWVGLFQLDPLPRRQHERLAGQVLFDASPTERLNRNYIPYKCPLQSGILFQNRYNLFERLSRTGRRNFQRIPNRHECKKPHVIRDPQYLLDFAPG